MVKIERKIQKVFGYKKDDISLNFTLRVDIKDELIAFKELLDLAHEDINNEIDNKVV